MALLFATTLLLLRRRSAQSRYIVGCVTLALMVIAPIVTIVLRPIARPLQYEAVFIPSTQALPIAPSHSVGQAPALPIPVAEHAKLSILQDATIVWSLGLLIVSLWQIHGWITVRNLVRRSHPAEPPQAELLQRLCDRFRIRFPVAMRVCDQLTTPALVGWLRPVILIPPAALCELPVNYFESLILHELAHVRRHDYLINLLQTAAETLLFYHPAAWWVSRVIRQEREYCCDDQAAVHASAATYARALAAMESLRASTPARLALAANDGNLLRRIRRLTAPRRARSVLPGTSLVAVAVILCAALPSVLLRRAVARPQTPAPASQPADRGTLEYHRVLVGPIELTIRFGAGGVIQTCSVDPHGDIQINPIAGHPLAQGGRVHAAGLTPKELEHAVADAFSPDASAGAPTVRAIALDSDFSAYFVTGDVKKAGTFQVIPDEPKLRDEIERVLKKVMANEPLSDIEVRPRDQIHVGTPAPASVKNLDSPQSSRGQPAADSTASPRDAILPEDLKEPAPVWIVRPGDDLQLVVQIDKLHQMEFFNSKVSAEGRLRFGFSNDSFDVSGLTYSEVQKLILEACRARFQNPLQLFVAFSTGHFDDISYTVIGSRLGGEFKASNHIRLLEAVMEAKGKNEPRARRIYILRTDKQRDGVVRHIEIPVDKLLAGDVSCNVIVRPNDTIVVEPSN